MGERGRKAGATNRKRGGSAGLAPATFPRSVAWRVDQDYTEHLSVADKPCRMLAGGDGVIDIV